MFALAAIAAAAFMAFLGATSASAVTSLEKVVLCKVINDPCPAAQDFGAGTVFHGELVAGTVMAIETASLRQILCATSKFKGVTAELLAHGKIEEFKFTSCVRDKLLGGTEACTLTEEHLNYVATFLLSSDDTKYHLVLSSSGNGKPQVKVVCGTTINCTFSATELLYESLIDQVNSDVVLDIEQELERAGGLCPTASTMAAKYLMRCLEPAGTYALCVPAMET
jgi:hypothetical protein